VTSYPPPTPPGYPGPYANPYAPSGPQRPGLGTAAAVLAFVAAGLLIVAGLMLMASGSVANLFDDNTKTAELIVCGVINFAGGGVLIAAGVGVLSGRAQAYRLYLGGSLIVVIMAIYWLARYGLPPLFWAVIFLGLVITGASFLQTQDVRRWLAESR
jgi:hypothetical protein